jgi:hypothetical protein
MKRAARPLRVCSILLIIVVAVSVEAGSFQVSAFDGHSHIRVLGFRGVPSEKKVAHDKRAEQMGTIVEFKGFAYVNLK